ncbi:hypothetical protein MANI_019136 [Metarhizium anisopliae]
MAFRTTNNRLDPDANASAEVQQSGVILPLQYDSLIALVDLARRAPQDPLSMCIPLFAHAAFSEVQFLNLIESRIQTQMNAIVKGVLTDTLGTLQYLSNILNRHARQLQDSIAALCNLAERRSHLLNEVKVEARLPPKSAAPTNPSLGKRRQMPGIETVQKSGSNSSDGSFTAKGLLNDYQQLCARCIDLSKMCTRGMTLAMNKATIEESRKAIEQSERLKKLTLLATFFIPLSFSSSLFSMNIDLLEQRVKFWWFFVLCIPITLLAYILYLWDLPAMRQFWVRFWKACHGVGRDGAFGSSEKDASYVV